MDVCVNEVTPTVFCDEEGYDIIPIHMVGVFHEKPDCDKMEQEPTTTKVTPRDLKLFEEVSIRDQSQAIQSLE